MPTQVLRDSRPRPPSGDPLRPRASTPSYLYKHSAILARRRWTPRPYEPVPNMLSDPLGPQTRQEAGPCDPASRSSPRLDRGPSPFQSSLLLGEDKGEGP